MDTVTTIIQLPHHHLACLFEILDTIGPQQRCTTVNKWQKVLGEIHLMVLATPDRKGALSVLQDALEVW
jgi:hypothetical protein